MWFLVIVTLTLIVTIVLSPSCKILSNVLYLFDAACVGSQPGQVGRCDGYILEGRELEFYLRKIKAKKGKSS